MNDYFYYGAQMMNSSATRIPFLMAIIIAMLVYIHSIDSHLQPPPNKIILSKNLR